MTFAIASVVALLWAGTPDDPSRTPLASAELHGTVSDTVSGAAVVDAEVQLASSQDSGQTHARADAKGHFQLPAVAPGDYLLETRMAGHQPYKAKIHLDAGDRREVAISLDPQLTRHSDSVTVDGSLLLDDAAPDSIDRVSLAGENLKNLSTVLADDPMRAVQALPGVTGNDDFNAQFSLRGAGFDRIGIYLDGIKLHNAVHSLEGSDLSGSASSFNSSLIRQLDLYQSSYSEKYGDTSGAVLDVQMRDANPDRYSFKLAANLGTIGVSAGGPFGRYQRCGWTAGYRKSYLQYLLARTTTDPSMAFGIEDAQGRVSCHVGSANTLSFELIDSHTNLDRSAHQALLGVNSLMLVNQHVQTANLSWIFSPSDRLQVDTHAAWMRDNFDAQNPLLEALGRGGYHEKVLNSNVNWLLRPNASTLAGGSIRGLGEDGFTLSYDSIRGIRQNNSYRGAGMLSGGYIGQTWTGWHDRLHVSGTGRWDRHSVDGVTAFSPQAGLSLRLSTATTLQLGWGQYVQFPELSLLGSNLGNNGLLPIRSTQSTAAIDQRLPGNLRLKIGVYERRDRDLLYQPYGDPRFLNNQLFIPPINPLYANSLRGRARGAEFYLQRPATSRLGGWISYSYSKTVMRDGISGASFPSDWDQRHTATVYATYRLRPSINLSAKWAYGSGFPIPGYFRIVDGSYYLADQRNQARLPAYQRLDLRVNKDWQSEHWRKSLYIEVMNLTNRHNYRFGSLDGYNGAGLTYVTVDTMFPILPTVGFVLEH